jgi:hypothetical protein
MPAQTDAAALQRAGTVLADIGNTVAHNLYRPERQPSGSKAEPRTHPSHLPRRRIPRFRRGAARLLEAVDEWLTAHEVSEADDTNAVRLGLGMYWIEDPAPIRRGKS